MPVRLEGIAMRCQKCKSYKKCERVWKDCGENPTCVGFMPIRTNSTRLREMPDEELAKELAAISGYLANPEEVSFWLYWLRQEVKEDA